MNRYIFRSLMICSVIVFIGGLFLLVDHEESCDRYTVTRGLIRYPNSDKIIHKGTTNIFVCKWFWQDEYPKFPLDKSRIISYSLHDDYWKGVDPDDYVR